MKTWEKLKNQPATLQKYLIRERVIDAIRAYFKDQGFHEVETPLLVQHPGTEPYLEVFETQLKLQDHQARQAFLLTSPEYAMKKLLAAGLGSIFTICKSFRNQEGLSDFHNPEFTILEFYRVEADYTDIMRDCEGLLRHLAKEIYYNPEKLLYQGKDYDLSLPWERITVAEAFEQFAQVAATDMLEERTLIKIAKQKGYVGVKSWEEAYYQIFLNEIEPELGKTKPTFLYDYPISQAALSKVKAVDPRFAERFELYLAGLELGNAFSELTDASEQEKRLQAELTERSQTGKTSFSLDQDFIVALESGIPETGGIAIGVDRLVMLFADVASVQETLFFPVEDVFDLQEK